MGVFVSVCVYVFTWHIILVREWGICRSQRQASGAGVCLVFGEQWNMRVSGMKQENRNKLQHTGFRALHFQFNQSWLVGYLILFMQTRLTSYTGLVSQVPLPTFWLNDEMMSNFTFNNDFLQWFVTVWPVKEISATMNSPQKQWGSFTSWKADNGQLVLIWTFFLTKKILLSLMELEVNAPSPCSVERYLTSAAASSGL